MRIHKEGYLVVVLAILIWLGVNFLVSLTDETFFRIFILLATTPVLFLAIRFFRYPHRVVKQNPAHLLSPADGTIVAIEETYASEYFHVNWIPIPGTVRYFKHHSGNFMAAYLPKSSTENERATTVVQMENGTEVLVRQIAGAVAKRIISYPKVGEVVTQETELGFIRFGSRVDIFLPVGTPVDVALCEAVTGSQTVIARL